MTFNDFAITLIKKPIRESDIIASVYTKKRGRLHLRFPGAKKHKGKLKIFAEPFVSSEIRVYMRNSSAVGCATGGKVNNVFGNIRKNFEKTQTALDFCKLTLKMTPLHQPNEDKYHLLLNALESLNSFTATDGMYQAFNLRLMKIAGFGISKAPFGIEQNFWDKLHNEPFCKLSANTPQQKEYLDKTSQIIKRFFDKYFS